MKSKMLISIPAPLIMRLKIAIPSKQRSKVITSLIEKEIEKREKRLYDCAVEVENDKVLNKEMKDWNITLQDGLDDGTW
jgi:hypothetical protein